MRTAHLVGGPCGGAIITVAEENLLLFAEGPPNFDILRYLFIGIGPSGYFVYAYDGVQ